MGSKHLTNLARTAARQEARDQYARGHTIRHIATQLGHSYGLTRKLLLEAGVELRGRGGHLDKTDSR